MGTQLNLQPALLRVLAKNVQQMMYKCSCTSKVCLKKTTQLIIQLEVEFRSKTPCCL